MQQRFFKRAMLAAMLASVVCAAGCKVEKMPTPEQQQQEDARLAADAAVTAAPTPTTDNAAAVLALCGPAASDEIVTVNDKHDSGRVRRLVYRPGREITLDFIPLLTSSGSGHAATSSNTIWRFNEARVDKQRLLTAANIRVYLPCAANALAKEF